MLRTDILKKHNLLEILKTVREHGPITKPKIAALTGLAGATVHNLVTELCAGGIIAEDGIANSNGGRKASIFRFNESKYQIIGINVGAEATTIISFDMNINPINKSAVRFALAEHSVEEGIAFLEDSIDSFIEKTALSKEDILGIGISVPGPVNSDEGKIIRLICAPDWVKIPLGSILARHLDIPVFVGNDSNNTALYLHDSEKNREVDNMVFVSTTNGIGTGIIINGKLFHGSHFVSGEIGHISVNLSGEECTCGNRGCIEQVASGAGILKIAENAIAHGQDSKLSAALKDGKGDLDMNDIIQAAKENDVYTLSLLESAASYISICIGDIIRIYDPEKIVVSSGWLGSFPDIYNSIKNSVYEKNNLINRDSVAIDLAQEDDLFALGGAAMVMDYHLNETERSSFLEKANSF